MPITQARLAELLSAAESIERALRALSSSVLGITELNRDRLPADVAELLSQVASRPDLLVASELALLAIERTRYQLTHRRNATEARYRRRRKERLLQSPDRPPQSPDANHQSIREPTPANSQITTLISDGELCSPDGTILPAGTRVDIMPSGRWFISPAQAQDELNPEDELDAALRGAAPGSASQ